MARRSPVMNKRRAGIVIVSILIILAFVAFLGVLATDSDPEDPEASATPTASIGPTSKPTPKRSVFLEEPTCTDDPQGDLVALESFDGGDWQIVEGSPTIGFDETNKAEGSASLRLDNEKQTVAGWIEKTYSPALDFSDARRILLWIRHNGNVFGNREDWRVRLVTDTGSYYEYSVPAVTVSEAVSWCHDSSPRRDWFEIGAPDWSSISSLQVNVPAYPGAGAGMSVWYDELAKSR